MYEMSQRHPVLVAENHVNPCNSVLFELNVYNKNSADQNGQLTVHANSCSLKFYGSYTVLYFKKVL
jgi:hypothetical protein